MRYLKQFDDCFARKDTRAHLPVYVEGQLSDLDAKSCEPIALHAGVAPRTLQEFLAQHKWNEDRVRDRVREIVLRQHSGPNTIGIIDETSDVKKGDKTPGVKRQWCGTVGKTANCIVTVHLGYGAIFTVCSMASCSFRKTGRKTGSVAVLQAFPRRLATARSGRSRWTFTTVPGRVASSSTGWWSTKDTVENRRFCGVCTTAASRLWRKFPGPSPAGSYGHV